MKRKSSADRSVAILLAVVGFMIIIFLFWRGYQNRNFGIKSSVSNLIQTPSIVTSVAADEKIFSGKITDFEDDCYVDGVCSIKVNDNWIIVQAGDSPEIHGMILHTDGASTGSIGRDQIGQNVEVFVKKISDNSFTLYGKKEYYIRLLP